MRLISAFVLVSFVTPLVAAEPTAKSILESASSYWNMANQTDHGKGHSTLAIRGDLSLNQPLSGKEREDSLARGGDGMVADLNFGWLDAGHSLKLEGDQFSALIRFACPSGKWNTRGLFAKGGPHDRLTFNFFSHDFSQGPEGMRLGCEIGVEGKPGLAGQVTAHINRIGASAWHDVIAVYNGKELALYVDGVELDRKPCSGKLRPNTIEPLAIGAGTNDGKSDSPFPGLIDHAAVWNRALSTDEVVALSGGKGVVETKTKQYGDYHPKAPKTPTSQLVQSHRELAQRWQADPHRPQYHFVAPEGGDNMPFDPNGAIYWKGRYHLFYIFQTTSPHIHHWGHASSIDMVHWQHHPTGLAFTKEDPDQGIFSGNAFVNLDGKPTILYHGVSSGNCIATAEDNDLIAWKKSATNPIVAIPKQGEPDFGKYESWDPHGWTEDGRYLAIFGGKSPALFTGKDLTKWNYVGPFIKTDQQWDEPGEDISCPDFFPIGKHNGKDRYMLLCISHRRGARYFLGDWNGKQFEPVHHERMNWPGGGYFAPETLLDDQGRRIAWAWVMDPRSVNDRIESGWSGVMSLPRTLALESDGTTVRIEPVADLERLRHRPVAKENVQVAAKGDQIVDGVAGDSLELNLEFDSTKADRYGVVVRRSPDGKEETRIIYDAKEQTLSVDFGKSTLDPTIVYRSWCIFRPDDPADAERRVKVQTAPLALKPGEPLRLRILLDRSMLEVFANGRQCVTQRIFPTRKDSRQVAVFSEGAPTTVKQLRAWEMAATNSR